MFSDKNPGLNQTKSGSRLKLDHKEQMFEMTTNNCFDGDEFLWYTPQN